MSRWSAWLVSGPYQLVFYRKVPKCCHGWKSKTKLCTETILLTCSDLNLLMNLTEGNWECCSCGLTDLALSALIIIIIIIIRGVSLPVSQNKFNKRKWKEGRDKGVCPQLSSTVNSYKKIFIFVLFWVCLHLCCLVIIAVLSPQWISQQNPLSIKRHVWYCDLTLPVFRMLQLVKY